MWWWKAQEVDKADKFQSMGEKNEVETLVNATMAAKQNLQSEKVWEMHFLEKTKKK